MFTSIIKKGNREYFQGEARAETTWLGRRKSSLNWLITDKAFNFLLKNEEYNPTEFWKSITSAVCSSYTGPKRNNNRTGIIDDWSEVVIDRVSNYNVQAVADFIQAGKKVLLDGLKGKVGEKKYNIDSQQKALLRDFYQYIFEDERLQPGLHQVFRDYLAELRDSRPSNPPEIISNLTSNLKDGVFGIDGDFPLVDDSGEHFFQTELKRFVESDEYKSASIEVKDKLIREATKHFIPQLAVTDKPDLITTYESCFLMIINGSKSGYGQFKANQINSSYEGTRLDLVNAPEDAKKTLISVNVKTVLEPLTNLLRSNIVGPGFRSEAIYRETVLLLDSVIAVLSGKDSFIQAVVFEELSKELIDILKETKNPQIATKYRELVTQSLSQGQTRLANLNLSTDINIKKVIQETVDRINDEVVGIQGETGVSLSDTFNQQFEKLIDIALTQTSEIRKKFIRIADEKLKLEAIKMATANRDGARAQNFINLLKKIDEKMPEDVIGVEIDLMQPIIITEKDSNLAKSLTSLKDFKLENVEYLEKESPIAFHLLKEFNKALKEALELQKDSSEVRQIVFEQVIEQQKTIGVIKTWDFFINDITNSDYGVGGGVIDLSSFFITRFNILRNKIHNSPPELQYLFYRIGKDHLIDAVSNPNVKNKPELIKQLRTLLDENVLKEGKNFSAELIHREAREIDSQINEKTVKELSAVLTSLDMIPSGKLKEFYPAIIVDSLKKTSYKEDDGKVVFDIEEALILAKQQAIKNNTNSVMKKYWDGYFNNLYNPAILKGTYADISDLLKGDHENLMGRLKDLNLLYSGEFLKAGIKSIVERFKLPETSLDERQQLIISALYLLVNSEVANRMRSKEEEGVGTKFKYGLGAIQAEFIKMTADEPFLSKALMTYISSKVPKDPSEERLCLNALNYNGDAQMRRVISSKDEENVIIEIDDTSAKKDKKDEKTNLNLGKAPSIDSLVSFERGLQSAYESITKLLKNGHDNALMNSLSTIGVFSPWTMLRIGMLASPEITVKGSREIEEVRVSEINRLLINSKSLSPAKKSAIFYALTGKVGFFKEAIAQYIKNAKLKKRLENAVTIQDKKGIKKDKPTNLFDEIFRMKEDIAQISGQPGIAAILAEGWSDETLMLRQAIFEKFITTVELRIRDDEINNSQQQSLTGLANKVGLELLGLSMILENTPGEDDTVKTTEAARIFSNLFLDILLDQGTKYHQDIKDYAKDALTSSLPYWSEERIKVFIEAAYLRAVSDNTWIEANGWKSIMQPIAVVHESLIPKQDESLIEDGLVRKNLGEMVIDMTLKILSGYTTLGGRLALKSPFYILTGKTLVWGENYIDPHASSSASAEQRRDFIRQAIAMTCYYAPGKKDELKRVLEKLGRQDLLKKAVVGFNPGFTQKQYLQKSEALLQELITKAKEGRDKLAQLFDRSQLVRPLIEIDSDGRVIGLTKTKLLKKLEKERNAELKELSKGVEDQIEDIRRKAQEKIKEKTLEGNWEVFMNKVQTLTEQFQGTVKFDDVIKALEEIGSSDHGASTLIDALKTKAQSDGSEGKTYIHLNDAMELLGLLLSSQAQLPEALSNIVSDFLSNRASASNLVQQFLTEIKVTDMIEDEVELQSIITRTITEVLNGEKNHIATKMSAELLVFERYRKAIQTITELETELLQDKKGFFGQASKDDIELMKKELSELKDQAEQEFADRKQYIEEWKGFRDKSAGEIAKWRSEIETTAFEEISALMAMIKGITKGASKSKTVKEKTEGREQDSTIESLREYAKEYVGAVASLGDGADLVLNMHNLKVDPTEVFEALNLQSDYMELLKLAGFDLKIDESKVNVQRRMINGYYDL